MNPILLLAGGVLLYLGAEWLVGGAARLAASLRVPQLVVGLTVVAYGTSAPEVVVSVQAAIGGHGDVALGNVVGSNIANLGLIMGIAVLLRPAQVNGALRRRELPVLLASTAALPLILFDGQAQPWEGVVLLLAAIGYTTWTVYAARSRVDISRARGGAAATAEAADAVGAPKVESRARQMVIAAAGLAILVLGGHLFVGAATAIARDVGVSERVVGLTIVAIGTSLPELATSIVAARRGHSDIAVGNVVGSNIFNVLLCLGVAGTTGNIVGRLSTLAVDLGVLGAMTVAAIVFLRSERLMRRWEGLVLLTAYLAFLGYLIVA